MELSQSEFVSIATRRVMVVEDSFMTARSIVRLLEDLGVKVVGPASSVQKAMALLDANTIDAAVLDINLGNETVEAVAQRLDSQGVPFVFVSGYSSPKLVNPAFKSRTLVSKPVDPTLFRRAVTTICPTS